MKKLFIVMLSMAAFLLPAKIYAQSCGVIRHGPIYTPPAAVVVKDHVAVVKEVIVKEVPIAVPVLVPAFQFQYQPPCYAPACAVPPPVAGYGQPHGNNSAAYGNGPPMVNYGQPQQPSSIPSDKDKIRELAKALLEEIQRQSNDDGGPPAVSGDQGQGTPPGVPPGLPSTPPGVPPGVPSGMTAQQAAPLAIAGLQRNCASCHTGIGSKGDTIIFTQPGVLDPNAPWSAMKRAIESGHMPPKQSQFRPTPEEIQALRIWLGSF